MSSSSISELDQQNVVKNDNTANQASSTLDLDYEQNDTQASRLKNINPKTLGEKFSSNEGKYLGGKDAALNSLPRLKRKGNVLVASSAASAEEEVYDEEQARLDRANMNPYLHERM
uniref:Uncharacterized protein n=1 Tax=Percolomonas cosmopolitus TaxID=63605 RepID=A0A7S1KUN2_9EUKA|mmetsp:Transcript_9462/g.35121  ORF Transcript_9462/g.35121 Transcript_9462/m.35121 type:complete len:116 (+) Transcript_9462:224-571(+)